MEQGWAAAEGGLKERRRQEAEARRAADHGGSLAPLADTSTTSAPVSGLLSAGDSWVSSGERPPHHPPPETTATATAAAQPSPAYVRWLRALAAPTALAAVRRLQATYRANLTRRVLSTHFLQRTVRVFDPPGNASTGWKAPHIQAHQPPSTGQVRVFDPTAGRDYYYDTDTGQSSWQPPVLLSKADRCYLAPI